jgi:hypothetical protein
MALGRAAGVPDAIWQFCPALDNSIQQLKRTMEESPSAAGPELSLDGTVGLR